MLLKNEIFFVLMMVYYFFYDIFLMNTLLKIKVDCSSAENAEEVSF